MPEIWSQIPSPPEPRFPSSRWAAEEEVYRRLENLEEPVGIKTRMYQYQFVSASQDYIWQISLIVALCVADAPDGNES